MTNADADAREPPTPLLDQSWVQTMAYEINTTCSGLQRIACAWRDHPRRDPLRVASAARAVAQTLLVLADQVEAKRNACLAQGEFSS